MLSLVRLMACWFIHQVNELRLWRVTLNATFPRSSTLACCGFTLNERIQRRKPTSMFISFFLIKSKNVMILHTSTGVQDANPPICRVVHSTAFPSSNEILITHILSWYKSQMFWLLLAHVLCLSIKSSWSWTWFNLCFPKRREWRFNNSTGVFQETASLLPWLILRPQTLTENTFCRNENSVLLSNL